jgi:alpha-L-fucosidase
MPSARIASSKSLVRHMRVSYRCAFHAVATQVVLIVILILFGADVSSAQIPLEPLATGKYQPSWQSFSTQYQVPDWFRDAKLGIRACWSAQSVAEMGDDYARNLYIKGEPANVYHVGRFGDPATLGYKELINAWTIDKWEPQKLVDLFQRAGARYVVAMASDCDNFDLYDSQYQSWNSVKVGPKKDIVGNWAETTRKTGLKFGVSVGSARAWNYFEPARELDARLPPAAGQNTWWYGLDPQDLYAQNHAPRVQASQPYMDRFYNRTADLINRYYPDLLGFDDAVLPFGAGSEIGLRLVAHFYNASLTFRREPVLTTRALQTDVQRRSLVLDNDRSPMLRISPYPWQENLFISETIYRRGAQYKSSGEIIHTLVDVISKNGNLLLNVPLRADGSLDDAEQSLLEELAEWMEINAEAIHGTRPFGVFGEGPQVATVAGRSSTQPSPRYTSSDFRFVQKGPIVYVFVMQWPANGKLIIRNLSTNSPRLGVIAGVQLLGSREALTFMRDREGLSLQLPPLKPCDDVQVLKITPR